MVEKAKEFDKENFLEVKGIKPLFPLPFSTEPLPPKITNNPAAMAALSQPLLQFKLENGKTFRMSGIPTHVAVEIKQIIDERQGEESTQKDPRVPLSALVNEIIDVKRVKVSQILSDLGVYIAEIDYRKKGEGEKNVFTMKMIPSHALLAAMRGETSIYVSKDLVSREENRRREIREEQRSREREEKVEKREEDTSYYYI